MLENIVENGLLLLLVPLLLIVEILAVSNGTKKPICVIPKETVAEFALFQQKTEALLDQNQHATKANDVEKIAEQMVELKCQNLRQNADGDFVGLREINEQICSNDKQLASENLGPIEAMIDWAIGQLDKISNGHFADWQKGCCFPNGKWMGQVQVEMEKVDEFENEYGLEVFAWIRGILARNLHNACHLPTEREFLQNLAKFWNELKEGHLFQQHGHHEQQPHHHCQHGRRRRRRRRNIHHILMALALFPMLLVMGKLAAALFVGASAMLIKTILVGFVIYLIVMGLGR